MRYYHYLILCSIAAFCETADAFLVTPSGAAASTTFLAAYYYGVENNDPSSLEDDCTSADTLERLNHQRASLARVAAAFPPAGHALALNHIEDVRVLDVDHQHMDLHATICEEESCAAVAVPISFPHSCDNESEWQECVLENLQELDTQAELLLQHAEWEATNQEYHQRMVDDRNALLDTSASPILFPSWWTAFLPNDHEMEREAQTLQSLLNKAEFAAELRALATLWSQQPVQEALVCAIGPAGMILRASSSERGEAMQVDVSFPLPANSNDQLRTQVLNALDSVQPS